MTYKCPQCGREFIAPLRNLIYDVNGDSTGEDRPATRCQLCYEEDVFKDLERRADEPKD